MTGNGLEEEDEADDGPEGGADLDEAGNPPGLVELAAEESPTDVLAAAVGAGGVVAAVTVGAAAGLPCNCSGLRARFWLEVAADASVRTA